VQEDPSFKAATQFETNRRIVADAFKQAASEGIKPENMMKRAKEIAGDAVQVVGEELTKRVLCSWCSAMGAFAGGAAGAIYGR
jgi:hypothetical protein